MHQAASLYYLLQSDSSAGFKELYRYQKGIKRWLKNNSASSEECKDVFHDAMIAFYDYAQKKEFNLAVNPEQLLFGIAKNIWYKQLRLKTKLSSTEFKDPEFTDPEMEDIIEKERQYKLAGSALSELGQVCKELLFLYYFKQMPLEKIAEKLKLSNANVAKSTKYNCLAKAKKLIFR
jgi:RNA polymerase sigma factor (sigma-70 family)